MGRGSANVFKVENQEGLQEALAVVKDPIIQEYVQGDEYSIDVLSDRLGNAVSVVPRKRLATESGISVKGVTVKDGELIDYAKNISKELKLFGPSCIQCIKGRAVNFIEINLRFGGGSILSMHADENVLQNLVRIINDEKTIPAGGFKEGLIMLRHYSERFVSSEEIL
jgi:carbamoyl-phosphate synthase large subunit